MNLKEIYQALLDGETLQNKAMGNAFLLANGSINNKDINFYRPSEWSIKPKPLEFWVNVCGENEACHCIYTSREKAEKDARLSKAFVIKTIKLVEEL